MNARNERVDVTVNVHLHEQSPVTVEVFETAEHGPFVTVQLGDLPGTVSLYLRDEDAINALAAAVGQARAKLVGAQTRVKNEAAGQRELPVAC